MLPMLVKTIAMRRGASLIQSVRVAPPPAIPA